MKRISLKVCFILAVIHCSISSHAQITISQFIEAAKEDVSLSVYDEQIKYLQGKPYRLSMLNKLEVRASNNDLVSPENRLGVRVSPSNPWEVRSNTKYYLSFQETLALEKEMAFKEALEQRYFLVIDFLYAAELKSLREKDLHLLETHLSVLEKQQYSSSFDVDDFVDLKLEHMSKSVELDALTYDVTSEISKIEKVYPGAGLREGTWNTAQVITVDAIEKMMDSIMTVMLPSSTMAYQESKINLAKREYNLEKSNINLGFIQTQYTDGRDLTRKSPWGLSAGINIPITNPNKGDMAKRHLDVIEATNKKQISTANLELEKRQKANKLKDVITRYKAMEAKINSLQVGPLSKTLSSLHGNNPVVLIKFNSNILKLNLILVKLKQSVMTSYVEFLSVHDRLQQRPLLNYLSNSLTEADEK